MQQPMWTVIILVTVVGVRSSGVQFLGQIKRTPQTSSDDVTAKNAKDDVRDTGVFSQAVPMEDTQPQFCTAAAGIETCFGNQGSKCNKVPVLDHCGPGQQAVSVGSLAHDTCCRECKEGLQCSSQAPSAFTSLQALNGNYPCATEWRKAVWNALDDRYWCVPISTAASNVTSVPGQREYDTTSYTGHPKDRRILHNVQATSVLCAPEGTALDCIGCSECQGDQCAPGIGDSNFCCSGHFSMVQKNDVGKEWGTCAVLSDNEPYVRIPDIQLSPDLLRIISSSSMRTLILFSINIMFTIVMLSALLVNSCRNRKMDVNRKPLMKC
eukprot:gnl/TRDRNA2_/TRDRNA2_172048_c1_seq1.p1 gnl/TRDRNA2_/TRDRNA2_172048_c1~~gnl/TRDRNA2_/TRDRNA2_172048_c1_seq1.p1  ORF type:complete len:324 (+),score=43.17 gnl/TRDRNA2_/TRDRNA2_172048_c1_seq1:22-993(+)